MKDTSTNPNLTELKERFAQLTIQTGLNLQPGQCVRLTAEPAHREFVHLLVGAAYRAGAPYVHVEWADDLLAQSRLNHASPESLDYFPAYEVARYQQMADEKWARLAVVGPEHPDAFDHVDPQLMRRVGQARATNVKPYMQAQMANQFQWCSTRPTPPWP